MFRFALISAILLIVSLPVKTDQDVHRSALVGRLCCYKQPGCYMIMSTFTKFLDFFVGHQAHSITYISLTPSPLLLTEHLYIYDSVVIQHLIYENNIKSKTFTPKDLAAKSIAMLCYTPTQLLHLQTTSVKCLVPSTMPTYITLSKNNKLLTFDKNSKLSQLLRTILFICF